jgi:hypothetical protein
MGSALVVPEEWPALGALMEPTPDGAPAGGDGALEGSRKDGSAPLRPGGRCRRR